MTEAKCWAALCKISHCRYQGRWMLGQGSTSAWQEWIWNLSAADLAGCSHMSTSILKSHTICDAQANKIQQICLPKLLFHRLVASGRPNLTGIFKAATHNHKLLCNSNLAEPYCKEHRPHSWTLSLLLPASPLDKNYASCRRHSCWRARRRPT